MPTVNRKKTQAQTKKADAYYQRREWRAVRQSHLSFNPLCFYCQMSGRVTPANTLDHYKPRRLFPELEWTHSNFRSSCEQCHNLKRTFEAKCATRRQFEEGIEEFVNQTYRR